jgi:hypothetical protein
MKENRKKSWWLYHLESPPMFLEEMLMTYTSRATSPQKSGVSRGEAANIYINKEVSSTVKIYEK